MQKLIMFFLRAALMIVVSCSLLVNTATAREYTYSNPFSSKSSIVINSDSKEVSLNNHLGYEALFCEEVSDFYCISSRIFSFAVPKDVVGSKLIRWENNELSYEITGREKVNYLGNTYEVLVISSKQDDELLQYIYSAKSGLLMVSITSKDATGLLLLRGTCGLGAKECH